MYEHCKTCAHDNGDIGFCDKCGYTYMHRKYGLPPTEYEAKPKPLTNYDLLIQKTPKEMAELLDVWPECHLCQAYLKTCDGPSTDKNCKERLLEWLKQEVE